MQISYIGMLTQEVAIKPHLKIALKSDAKQLDEVMVVAYGTAKKSSFTGSATVISADKIAERPISNVTKALDGSTTGVLTTSGSGQPGEGAKIRIRGFGSINSSSDPLYVVDGIPFDGSISDIAPSDIESMTILKDASAGALYGARGANGVIIITTKKGSSGKTKVNYKGTIGFSTSALKRYDVVGQRDFVQLTYESLRNSFLNNGYSWDDAQTAAKAGLSGNLGGEIYNPFKNYNWGTIIDENGQVQADAKSAYNEDWIDNITNNGAVRHEHQLTLSGGTEKTHMMFSLGYLDENGVLKTTEFSRYNARLNIDTEVNKWIKAGLNAAFSQTKSNYSDYDQTSMSNVWYSAQFMAPIYPVYMKNGDGSNLLDENGEKQLDFGKTRPSMSNYNSIATLTDDIFSLKNDNLSARFNTVIGSDSDDAGWLKGLKLNINLGVDNRSTNRMYYYNMYMGNFSAMNGMIEKDNIRTFSYTFNQLITYNRGFGKHAIDFMMGHENYDYTNEYLEASKSNLVDGILELRPGTTLKSADSYTDKYRIESYMSRLNYNYDNRYYASVSWRTDGSSRFHKDNRWGNFWSVGGNWRASEEKFMKSITWINNLSVKASYGVQGNDNLLGEYSDKEHKYLPNYYGWQGLYDLSWINGTSTGAMVSSLENRKVSWEKNGNLNIGVEARLLDRIDLSFEYYNRKTTNMLLNYPMALSTGFTGYNANMGDMRNSGIELNLGVEVLKIKDFRWNVRVMASTVKNKVLKLTSESPEIINGYYSTKVGSPINTFYMAKSAGVDPANGKQLYWIYDKDENGNIINERISDDYSKAAQSKYYLGSRIPKLYGSIGTDLAWKGLDFSILGTYSIGGKVYDSTWAGLMNPTYSGDTFSSLALRRWQKPGDITDVPRVEIGGNYTATDRFLVNASYFSIKNISLGYTIPANITRKASINSLRVSFNCDNVYLFSHLNGMDPQYNFSGQTDYVYSPSRTFSFGIDVNF